MINILISSTSPSIDDSIAKLSVGPIANTNPIFITFAVAIPQTHNRGHLCRLLREFITLWLCRQQPHLLLGVCMTVAWWFRNFSHQLGETFILATYSITNVDSYRITTLPPLSGSQLSNSSFSISLTSPTSFLSLLTYMKKPIATTTQK